MYIQNLRLCMYVHLNWDLHYRNLINNVYIGRDICHTFKLITDKQDQKIFYHTNPKAKPFLLIRNINASDTQSTNYFFIASNLKKRKSYHLTISLIVYTSNILLGNNNCNSRRFITYHHIIISLVQKPNA